MTVCWVATALSMHSAQDTNEHWCAPGDGIAVPFHVSTHYDLVELKPVFDPRGHAEDYRMGPYVWAVSKQSSRLGSRPVHLIPTDYLSRDALPRNRPSLQNLTNYCSNGRMVGTIEL